MITSIKHKCHPTSWSPLHGGHCVEQDFYHSSRCDSSCNINGYNNTGSGNTDNSEVDSEGFHICATAVVMRLWKSHMSLSHLIKEAVGTNDLCGSFHSLYKDEECQIL